MAVIMGNELKSAIKSKKMLLILNPKAGMMHANKHLADIIKIFVEANFIPTVLTTTSKGDALRFASECSEGKDIVVCIGGDGTLNEAVAGILHSGNKTLVGYIPSGSTNDFANSIGVSKNILTAAQDITNGRVIDLDVGKFNGRYFSYVASFGAFTGTSYEVPQNIKNILGHTAYVLQGIREIPNIKSQYLKITTPERIIEGNFIFGAICNSTSVGGILSFEEFDINMNDGKVEVFLIRKPDNIIELNSMLVAIIDNSFNSPLITFFSTASAKIEASRGMPWTLDGEYEPGTDEINISIVHSGISIMVPEIDMRNRQTVRRPLVK